MSASLPTSHKLQQHLPFTVLKLHYTFYLMQLKFCPVATALTVYGIETSNVEMTLICFFGHVATALTVYGIETLNSSSSYSHSLTVATALTVYGIETYSLPILTASLKLQQHLPFTVLKLFGFRKLGACRLLALQQHLPFTVLKHSTELLISDPPLLTLQQHLPFTVLKRTKFFLSLFCDICKLQQHLPFTVLKQ